MGRFAVIGLGKFGSHVARTLYEKGNEVVGIDSDSARVQEMRDSCSQAIVANCTDQETLRAVGVGDSDAVILSLGQRMDASVLVTLYLRELGVQRIVVKALSDDHGKILKMIGATEIVHPERDTALRVANVLGTRSILEFLPLGVGFSLLELAAPKAFVGKSLAEMKIRQEFQVTVVAVKNGDRLDLVPGGDYQVAAGDVLVLVGKDQDLNRMAREAD